MGTPYPGEQFYPAKKVGTVGRAGLWIGSARDAADVSWLRRHRIGLVVNCTRHLPDNAAGIASMRVPVDDAPDEVPTMLRCLPGAVKKIETALASGKHVLVHCHAGMSRSATVAACFIAKCTCLPMHVIVAELQDRKPETFPPVFNGRPSFLRALLQWESQLSCAPRSID